MSSLVIAGDSSGQITLAAPAVAGTTTLTLPATTGTVLNDATVGVCRAWVSFAGATGTRWGSFNVSSVTRNGTGDYTVNFATALADGNYAAVCTTRNASIAGFNQGTLTSSSFRFFTSNTSGTSTDSTDNGVAVFR